jgi:hypothetical protein
VGKAVGKAVQPRLRGCFGPEAAEAEVSCLLEFQKLLPRYEVSRHGILNIVE